MKDCRFAELSPDMQRLCQAAAEVRKHAYAPYSDFLVGAGLLSTDGEIYTGVNVENVSYGLSICAERSAIISAVSQGVRDFKAIAITATRADGTVPNPVAPCGACRQFLAEFIPPGGDIVVLMADTNIEKIRVAQLSELLPERFGSELS